jgi:hypothetical protein
MTTEVNPIISHPPQCMSKFTKDNWLTGIYNKYLIFLTIFFEIISQDSLLRQFNSWFLLG